MKIASYTELKNNLEHHINAVIDDCDTLAVSCEDNKGIVMMPLDEYNSIMETLYIMSSPQTMADIHQSEEDLKNGDVYRQNEGESIDDFLERIACIE